MIKIGILSSPNYKVGCTHSPIFSPKPSFTPCDSMLKARGKQESYKKSLPPKHVNVLPDFIIILFIHSLIHLSSPKAPYKAFQGQRQGSRIELPKNRKTMVAMENLGNPSAIRRANDKKKLSCNLSDMCGLESWQQGYKTSRDFQNLKRCSNPKPC